MKTYSKEQRRHIRIKLPIRLRSKSAFGPGSRVENISLCGIRISSQYRLSQGEICTIELGFAKGRWIPFTVRTVWIVEVQSDTDLCYDTGCEFIEMSPPAEKALKRLLHR